VDRTESSMSAVWSHIHTVKNHLHTVKNHLYTVKNHLYTLKMAADAFLLAALATLTVACALTVPPCSRCQPHVPSIQGLFLVLGPCSWSWVPCLLLPCQCCAPGLQLTVACSLWRARGFFSSFCSFVFFLCSFQEEEKRRQEDARQQRLKKAGAGGGRPRTAGTPVGSLLQLRVGPRAGRARRKRQGRPQGGWQGRRAERLGRL